MRKFFKVFAIILTALLLLCFILPFVFKGRIIAELNKAINKDINGKIEFKDASVSIFKNFPKLTLSVEGISCNSYVNLDTSLLFQATEVQLGFNLWMLIRNSENLTITKLVLISPMINIVEYDSLKANYQIYESTSSNNSMSSKQFSLDIQTYQIVDGSIHYESWLSENILALNKIEHTGSLFYSDDLIKISTRTDIGELNFQQNKIVLLKSAKLISKLDLDYSKKDNSFNIGIGEFNLNNLKLECKGSVGIIGDSIQMDLSINAPNNQFKDLFSILPNAYTKDFDKVKSSGNFELEATLKGVYSDKQSIFPSWDLKCKVDDGSMQYPGKSIQLENFKLDLTSQNSGPTLKNSVIDFKTFSFDLNNQPFAGNVKLSNLQEDITALGKLKGILNLSDLNNFYPLGNNTSISGLIQPDLSFQFSESAIKNKQYEQIDCSGKLLISELKYHTSNQPDIAIPIAQLKINPKQLDIEKFDLRFGVSDLLIQGTLKEPMNFISKDLKVYGNLIAKSKLINAVEWNAVDPVKSVKLKSANVVPEFISKLSLDVICDIDRLVYSDYDIQSIKATAVIQGENVKLNNSSLMINKNQISGSGNLNKVYSFMMADEILDGSLLINTKSFDADKFLSKDGANNSNTGSATNNQAFVVPEKFNITVNFKADELLYNPTKMNAVSGKLIIAKSEIQIEEMSANILGGKIGLKGLYSTVNADKPYFNFKFDMLKLPFSGAISSFVTLKRLAPIMEYIQGFFNTNLIVEGFCEKDMMPILESIKADGLFETLEGSLQGFKPLNQLADKLKINSLKNLNIKNTKNWITVKDGMVGLKDFNKKIEDIDLNINGNHKIAGGMDYQIIIKIPKNRVSQFTSAIKLDHALDQLNSVLSKAGLGGPVLNNLNILVNMTGTFSNPSFSFKLLNSKGEVASETETIGESIKSKIVDSLKSRFESEKEKATAEIKKIQDSLKVDANKKVDDLKNQAIEKATKALDSTLANTSKEHLDSISQKILNKDAKKETDQIKDKLKEWNPFKKDKK